MGFCYIVVFVVVIFVFCIVLCIFVFVVEDIMVVLDKVVDYYRICLFFFYDDVYYLVYGWIRKYVMKKCGCVIISNWVKIK